LFPLSTRVLRSSKSTKISGRGFAPDPTGGAYSAPLDPKLVGGASYTYSQEPHPASVLRVLPLQF